MCRLFYLGMSQLKVARYTVSHSQAQKLAPVTGVIGTNQKSMNRQYSYVGPHNILQLLQQPAQRTHIRCADDVFCYIKETQQNLQRDRTIVATFIVDTNHQLWIADRHSEHVVCATGQPVLSAGEVTFALQDKAVEVVEVTNQSTGYCPEPVSWQVVSDAFDAIGIAHPSDFTTAFLFRRCEICETTNIVKDMWFECAVCSSPLSEQWNYDKFA